METIEERLDKIKERFNDEDFLANKGLSNEVGFHFFCYSPKNEMMIRNFIGKLKEENNTGYNVIEYDLYDVFLSVLDDKRILSKVTSVEEKKGKEHLLLQLQKIATPTAFIEKMKYDDYQLGDVLVLSGVGKVFPYMRMHHLMETMQSHFSHMPVVVFYPGKFDGDGISLFEKLERQKYYRAFDLI